MKDGLTNGVDKSRAGVEQLLLASRRVGTTLKQCFDDGAKSSDRYRARLKDLRQGVEGMSSSLKSMGVQEKEASAEKH